jgi:hypothetical protein
MIETSLATIIVGVAFVAVLQLIATGTVANMDSAELTSGINLARNVRELALQTPFDDLPGTYDGVTFKPPRDSRGATVSGMDEWEQVIAVQPVDPAELTLNITDETPVAVRITVTIRRHEKTICDLSWYSLNATP